MSDSRKKRMSLLDGLAAAGSSSAMMSGNRALRSARDAVDSHRIWELDPWRIHDDRTRDRLDPSDIADLREAIETNGQTVPIMVRRDPVVEGEYQLIYGRRRLEAIRQSNSVKKVRALVANLEGRDAVTAQISENMARRDLSFIEKALFASELVESGYGNQSQVADVLTVTKSSVSMAISIANGVGKRLIEAIGPAHGVGRPRWETLARLIDERGQDRDALVRYVDNYYTAAKLAQLKGEDIPDDLSVAAFDALLKFIGPEPKVQKSASARSSRKTPLNLDGHTAGSLQRTNKGLALELTEPGFADWIEAHAQSVLEDLYARWKNEAEE